MSKHLATSYVFEARAYLERAGQLLRLGELERSLGLYEGAAQLCQMADYPDVVQEAERVWVVARSRAREIAAEIENRRRRVIEVVRAVHSTWCHYTNVRQSTELTWRRLCQDSLDVPRMPEARVEALAKNMLEWLPERVRETVVEQLLYPEHEPDVLEPSIVANARCERARIILGGGSVDGALNLVAAVARLLYDHGLMGDSTTLLLSTAHAILALDGEDSTHWAGLAELCAEQALIQATLEDEPWARADASVLLAACCLRQRKLAEASAAALYAVQLAEDGLRAFQMSWRRSVGHRVGSRSPVEALVAAIEGGSVTVLCGFRLMVGLTSSQRYCIVLSDAAGVLLQRGEVGRAEECLLVALDAAKWLADADEIARALIGLARIVARRDRTAAHRLLEEAADTAENADAPAAHLAQIGECFLSLEDWISAHRCFEALAGRMNVGDLGTAR